MCGCCGKLSPGPEKKIKFTPSFFPEEIIEQILLNLPVKSLIRFKSVSNSWSCFISSKYFIDTHLLSASVSNRKRVFFVSNYTMGHFSLNGLLSGGTADLVYLKMPTFISRITCNYVPNACIVGVVNGIVCVTFGDEKQFYLLNPSTRVLKKLPETDSQISRDFVVVGYGFGYDETKGDYKVICIVKNSILTGHLVMIYSMKKDCWIVKLIYDVSKYGVQNGRFKNLTGTWLSGKLHWLIQKDMKYEIISLDIASEGWRVMETHETRISEWIKSLGVMEGYLTSVCYDRRENDYRIWILKGDGMKEWWEQIRMNEKSFYLEGVNTTYFEDGIKGSCASFVYAIGFPFSVDHYIQTLVPVSYSPH